jgi:membrane fusion protein (multidrug efflux system)
MDVSVKLDAYHGKSFRGKISRIYPDLDRRMRTRIAEVEIKDDVALDPGMFARLDLKLRTEKENVVVPSQAVIVTPTGLRVAFIIEDGKAVQRKIKTGLESEGKIQILSGINPGEQIVIAGNEKLKDGMAVRVQGKTKPDQKTQETPQAAPAPGAAK